MRKALLESLVLFPAVLFTALALTQQVPQSATTTPAPGAPVAAQTPTDSARPKLGSAPRPAAVPVIAPPPPDPDSSEDEEEEEEEEGGDLDEAEELE